MSLLPRRNVPLGFLLALLAGCAGSARAQGYKAEPLNEPPPQELSAAVRDALAPAGIRVTGPNGPLCDLWFRKALPANPNPAQDIGVAFPQVAEGTLVGVMRLPAATKDYRRQEIKTGVYTLRDARTPQNGNHLGVAPQRDFLLASPAAADPDPASLTFDQTVALSKKATGANHPSVWSLSPAEDNPKALPSVFHVDDGDLWLVEFQVPVAGGAPLKMALVVVGYAPEA